MANYKWYGYSLSLLFFSLLHFSLLLFLWPNGGLSVTWPCKNAKTTTTTFLSVCYTHAFVFVIIGRNEGNQDKCKNKQQIDLLIIDFTQIVWQFFPPFPAAGFIFISMLFVMLSSFVHIAEVIRIHKNNLKTTRKLGAAASFWMGLASNEWDARTGAGNTRPFLRCFVEQTKNYKMLEFLRIIE